MSEFNSAICKKCGRCGQKVCMKKILENGFVVGYIHKSCEDSKRMTKDIHNSPYSLKLYANSSSLSTW